MISTVMRKREPRAAMAWLLVIFLLPWPGLLLYFLIGQDRLPARRIEMHQRLLDELLALRARFQDHPNLATKEHAFGPEDRAAFELAQKLGYMPMLGGN